MILRLVPTKGPSLTRLKSARRGLGALLVGVWLLTCGTASLGAAALALGGGPVVEVDEAMLQRARSRIENRVEPFWTYWSQARADAAKALELAPEPSNSRLPLTFHVEARDQGMAARLLAYWWRLEDNESAGGRAVVKMKPEPWLRTVSQITSLAAI